MVMCLKMLQQLDSFQLWQKNLWQQRLFLHYQQLVLENLRMRMTEMHTDACKNMRNQQLCFEQHNFGQDLTIMAQGYYQK